jgi:hypothetical protein
MNLETEISLTRNTRLLKRELSENIEDIIFYDLIEDLNEIDISQFADRNSNISLSKKSDS